MTFQKSQSIYPKKHTPFPLIQPMRPTNKQGTSFCKVCKDAGKSEEEYTSHYLRKSIDKSSEIVCPTLLAAVCKFCKKTGHTIKHCTKIAMKKRGGKKAITKPLSHITRKICQPVNSSDNSFDILAGCDNTNDDNEDNEDDDDDPSPSNVIPHDVVTLYEITGRWADVDEDEDSKIFNFIDSPPTPYGTDHPLKCVIAFIDGLVRDYTDNFSKSISITCDAFHQLYLNWETMFFKSEGYTNATWNVKQTMAMVNVVMMRYIM